MNVLFLTMGPPAAAPNWLRWRNGFLSPALLAKKLLASSWLLRRNSYKVPWRLLVPERMTALTNAPALRPNSAEYALVWILNSCNASTEGCTTCAFSPRKLLEYDVLSTPSNWNAFWKARFPFTLNTPRKPMDCRRGVGASTPGDRSA